MHWRLASGTLEIDHPVFLGILNITPDSFSDGGHHLDPLAACRHARRLAGEGAGILDLGAESTRPGAVPLDPGDEWKRLEPVLDHLGSALPRALLSLDTRHPETARRGLARGIAIINDVTGFSTPALLDLVRDQACGLIAMRSRLADGRLLMPDYGEAGEPSAARAIEELGQVRDRILAAGIEADRVLLDPGFGFGTTFREDMALWDTLPDLPDLLDWPAERFCIGISRKRILAWRAGHRELPPAQRDNLTRQAHQQAMAWGYRVFRTHAIHGSDMRNST